jgi:hypothetical protein
VANSPHEAIPKTRLTRLAFDQNSGSRLTTRPKATTRPRWSHTSSCKPRPAPICHSPLARAPCALTRPSVRSNKAALWAQLLHARVVTSTATFDDFIQAFTNSSFVDIATTRVENKMAGLLTIHGAQPSLKRVYVGGVHPTSRTWCGLLLGSRTVLMGPC